MEDLNKILLHLFKNAYDYEKQEGLVKYFNKEFEVVIYKNRKEGYLIDKRKNLPVYYNSLSLAIAQLC